MFKMGCSMARRILGPGSTTGGNQEQTATCFSGAPSSSSGPEPARKSPAKKGAKAAGGENTGAAQTKSQPSSELNDFSKLEDDPRLPLNVRQIFKITKSWKAIARTMSKTGTAMFLNLFEQNQDLFYLFDRFQHLKGKELHESMELREHAATVMATLDTSINSLSDYDNFVSYLHSIGQLHRKVPGFKREYFWKIEQPFMKAVKQTLDERCNETIEEIYKIAIKLIIETIADGYGQDADGPGDSSRRGRDDASDSAGRGQSSSQSGGGTNNGGSGAGGKSDGRGGQAQLGGGNLPGGRQNQQTLQCDFARAELSEIERDKSSPLRSETAPCRPSAAGKVLSKVAVVFARVRLGWRRPTKFTSNQGAGCGPAAAREPELIRATCELMNTTKHLIDSCAEELARQPRAAGAARKLTGWQTLLADLNRLLMNEAGQSARGVDRAGHLDGEQSARRFGRARKRARKAEQSGAPEPKREEEKRAERVTLAGEITSCPMRQGGGPTSGHCPMQESRAAGARTSTIEVDSRVVSRVTGDDGGPGGGELASGPRELERISSNKDWAVGGRARHNRAAHQKHLARAVNGDRSCRPINSLKPQATRSINEEQLERAGAASASSLSNCSSRPTLSRCYFAAERRAESSPSGGHNGNLPPVSWDLDGPGQAEVNELGETSSPIKISATEVGSTGQEGDRRAAEPARTDLAGAPSAAASQARRHSSQLPSQQRPGGRHQEARSNDDRKCDHVHDASDVVGTNQTCDNNHQPANAEAVAFLRDGERSADFLWRTLEQRAGDQDAPGLTEFLKVIILVNKLILALASSSLEGNTTKIGPALATNCATTLVN